MNSTPKDDRATRRILASMAKALDTIAVCAVIVTVLFMGAALWALWTYWQIKDAIDGIGR